MASNCEAEGGAGWAIPGQWLTRKRPVDWAARNTHRTAWEQALQLVEVLADNVQARQEGLGLCFAEGRVLPLCWRLGVTMRGRQARNLIERGHVKDVKAV
jgi:hypothetical protein